MENESAPKATKPKRDKLTLFLLIVMTLSCGVFAWLYWIQKSEKETVMSDNIAITQESEVVKKDLQQLQAEYDALKTDDEGIKKEMKELKKNKRIKKEMKEMKEGKKWFGWFFVSHSYTETLANYLCFII